MWTIHCNVDLQSPSLIRLFMTPMDCIMPGFPVPYHLLELAHIYVHWVGDAFQPSQPLSPSSASTFSLSPASRSFPTSQLFISGSQSVRASAAASVLPINIQDWSPLGLIGLIFLQSKGLLSIFSSTTVQKHQFFSTLPSLLSSSHICMWLLESLHYMDFCGQSSVFAF